MSGMTIESWETILEMFPDFAVKLSVAFVCGLLLGAERESQDKPAGLRTIILITVGSTLFMIVSDLMPRISVGPLETMRVDPARIASQVVTGIGFLGAGTIIQTRGSVHGLTTAAIIWFAAAVGLCIGIGFPLLAIISTILVIAALFLLRPFRRRLSRMEERKLVLELPNDSLRIEHVRSVLLGSGALLSRFDIRPRDDSAELGITYTINESAAPAVLEALMRVDEVRGQAIRQSD